MKTIGRILVLCLVLAGCLSFAGCSKKTETVTLRIFNWGDYIDPDVLAEFEADNPDIKIIYDTYGSNEEMLSRLDAGVQYDILFPSDYMVEKLVSENRLAKLDLTQILNFKNLDTNFTNLEFDPNNNYSVPYTWGTLGILYNTKLVSDPVDSWGILFNKKYKGQVIMYDSVRDSMAVALKYLGYSCNDRDDAHLNEAGALLKKQKSDGIVKAYMMDNVKETMISGSAAFGVVYSGDATLCIDENPDLAYVVPKEGSNFFVDNIAVSKDCQNMEAAYRFINYLCDPQVAAKNYAYVGYPIANKTAADNMGDDYSDSTINNPGAAVLALCEVYLDLGDYTAVYNQIWESVKLQ